jgi:hypothetical protein
MNELTKACACVPRTGMPNRRPASTLLHVQTAHQTRGKANTSDRANCEEDLTNVLQFKNASERCARTPKGGFTNLLQFRNALERCTRSLKGAFTRMLQFKTERCARTPKGAFKKLLQFKAERCARTPKGGFTKLWQRTWWHRTPPGMRSARRRCRRRGPARGAARTRGASCRPPPHGGGGPRWWPRGRRS